MKLPEISKNPLGQRIVKLLSQPGSKKISFPVFIKRLNEFNSGDEDAKLRFLFEIYDMDGDNCISKRELKEVLKTIVGKDLNEQ